MTIQQIIAVLYLARFASNFNTHPVNRVKLRCDVLQLQADLRLDIEDGYTEPSHYTVLNVASR